jgi:hypothetical protein
VNLSAWMDMDTKKIVSGFKIEFSILIWNDILYHYIKCLE